VWIERDIGTTCFQNGQQSDHHFEAAFEANSYKPFWADSFPSQVFRQLIGLSVELTVR
jgi:hypothetical protein